VDERRPARGVLGNIRVVSLGQQTVGRVNLTMGDAEQEIFLLSRRVFFGSDGG
jgi:hypothetical protein